MQIKVSPEVKVAFIGGIFILIAAIIPSILEQSRVSQATQTAEAAATRTMLALLASATSTPPSIPMNTPTSTSTLTNIFVVTPTDNASPTPIIDATVIVARTPIASNSAWTPVARDFNGVSMVLVPAGCFTMGSSQEQIDYVMTIFSGDNDFMARETPTTLFCFNQPFWIDQYEVSNAQFRQFNGQAANASAWGDDNRPRDNIRWLEASTFCASREARLPSEAEWEYAARGPDSLIFPWGNTFDANNLVYGGNSAETATVGSRPTGRSWVGAYDMVGNVWEWIGTPYDDYPYLTDRNNFIVDNLIVNAVSGTNLPAMRGGSWETTDFPIRAAWRIRAELWWHGGLGIRCVSDYEN